MAKGSHKGVIEALRDTPTKWWQTCLDLFMNSLQGQTTPTNVTVRFKQIKDNLYDLGIIEKDSTGVGMTENTLVEKYYHTHTLDEKLKDPSKGVGVHTMGVGLFTMKMTKGREEFYGKGLEVLTRIPHETKWINHNYDIPNLKNVKSPRKLTDNEAIKLGYPIAEIGTHGSYQHWPIIDTSDWGDNWFEELAQLIECYFVFTIGSKLNFTLEKHDKSSKPIIRECQKMVFPCTESPYIDEWTTWKDVKLGNNNFPMKALLRPRKEELDSSPDYKKIKQKYEGRMWKHPYENFSEDMVLLVVEKDTNVILDIKPRIVKSGVTQRGTVVIKVGKHEVSTDINKSQVRFISSKGEAYADSARASWLNPIKERFDDFFPYSKENETSVRNQFQDVLTGKKWPSHLLPIVYEQLCRDMNIKPYDYDYAKKNFMKKTLGDSILDIYDSGNRCLYELKIKPPCKDLDYNQIKSYGFEIVVKKHELSDTKRIVMFANSNGKGFDNDTIEKFTTRLNDGQDKIEFVLLDLSDYGLETLSETYKDAPKK